MTLTEPTRAWIYRVLLALQPLAIYYGRDGQEVGLWIAVASAVLGTGLATANTSTSRPDCTDCLGDRNAPHGENPELIDDLEVR